MEVCSSLLISIIRSIVSKALFKCKKTVQWYVRYQHKLIKYHLLIGLPYLSYS